MNLSEAKREELEEKLKWIDEYNRGKRKKPNFPPEVLREVRDYQLEKECNSVKELRNIKWQRKT